MPIIKSSESGEHITTIIFNASEMAALIHLLSSGAFHKDEETISAIRQLEDLEYGLGIRIRTNL